MSHENMSSPRQEESPGDKADRPLREGLQQWKRSVEAMSDEKFKLLQEVMGAGNKEEVLQTIDKRIKEVEKR